MPRTFEIENSPFPVQLEFLEFEKLTDSTSKLNMHIVFRSVEDRNQLLRLPFAHGLNMGAKSTARGSDETNLNKTNSSTINNIS